MTIFSFTASGLEAILGSVSIRARATFFSSARTSSVTWDLSQKRGFSAAICMATFLPISVASTPPSTARFTSTPILPPAWT